MLLLIDTDARFASGPRRASSTGPSSNSPSDLLLEALQSRIATLETAVQLQRAQLEAQEGVVRGLVVAAQERQERQGVPVAQGRGCRCTIS